MRTIIISTIICIILIIVTILSGYFYLEKVYKPQIILLNKDVNKMIEILASYKKAIEIGRQYTEMNYEINKVMYTLHKGMIIKNAKALGVTRDQAKNLFELIYTENLKLNGNNSQTNNINCKNSDLTEVTSDQIKL